MTWGAVAVGGATLLGGALSSSAAKSAAKTQANAANSAAQAQQQQFNTINEQQAPYRQAGYGALNLLNLGLGEKVSAPEQNEANFDSAAYIAAHPEVGDPAQWDPNAHTAFDHYQMYGKKYGFDYTGNAQYQQQLAQSQQGAGGGNLLHQFGAEDLGTNLSPSYDFMLKQGLGTAANEANATGGLVGGNALQGLNKFAQDYASTGYQQAYQNYNANQTNIFNRLADIAGLGQTANQSTANAGMATTNAATGYSTSAAAANAAGTVGQANAINNGISNAMGWGYLYGGGNGGNAANDSLGATMARAGDNGLGMP